MGVAAEVLAESDVATARGVLAAALLERTGALNAARVHVGVDGQVTWFRTGPAPDVPPERMPTPEDMRRHPLFRFHVDRRHDGPVLLAELVRRGYDIPPETMEVNDRLGITVHQLSVPVEPPGPETGYDGWMLVGDEALRPGIVEEMVEAQPLLRGLDRHLRLLGELVPRAACPLLTPRESVVLAMLATGATVKAISHRLLISPRTVHKHQEHLYRKLAAVDRLSAVLRGQELGLLTPPQPEAPGRSSMRA
ncbi:response regulator transcription factor [Ornithinimicrobium cerasi]|uniref:Regulatory protein, luxR family n=1 Tax=Ornithinimicrobium cerasi TaxID=2248773 RepID=A0A285VVB9_9MICO|nr:helix-turn-helix transcriptional regulator [Ornithinimicrobium cerasi]SOC57975.1 regulatory protein, luxR family [Ornithinimicrobium cerasi]